MGKLNLWDVFEKLTGGFSSSQNGNEGASGQNPSADFGANGQKNVYGAGSDTVFGGQKTAYDNGKNNDNAQSDTSNNIQKTDNTKQNLNGKMQNLNNGTQISHHTDKNAKTYTFDLLKRHNEASARIDERIKNK